MDYWTHVGLGLVERRPCASGPVSASIGVSPQRRAPAEGISHRAERLGQPQRASQRNMPPLLPPGSV